MSSKKAPYLHSTKPVGYRFSKQTILSIVEEIENGLSRSDACRKYGMNYCTACTWVKRYGSSDKLIQRSQFREQERREIARTIMQGRMSVKEAQIAFKVSYPDTIRKWIRKLIAENVEVSSAGAADASSKMTVNQYHHDLEQANLKIAALETMIDVAEQEYKISIRKKSGAKQFLK